MAAYQPRLSRSRDQIRKDRESRGRECAGAAEGERQGSEPHPSSATEVSLRKLSDVLSPRGEPLASSLNHAPRFPIKLSKRFGRYRIIKRLGRGAMGSVYLAHDTQLDRRVALKVPHFRTEGDASEPNRLDVDRFYREARIAATLDHPNLCPVYDVGQIDGIHYLSMAYIKGRPLSDYIDPRKPMPPQRVAAVLRKLALALAVAHGRGVVHRDLKPSNIMVNSRRELIIMDFGLAWRLGSSDERLTKTGMVLGTPAYMSPEQLSGNAEDLGPRCDIYSLGVIMYELLTACRPFSGQEAVILGQILFIEPAPPSGHRPDLDARIEAICLKAMAKRPEERYGTMDDLATALGDYVRACGLPPHAPSPVARAESSGNECARGEPDPEEIEAEPFLEPGCAPGSGTEPVVSLELCDSGLKQSLPLWRNSGTTGRRSSNCLRSAGRDGTWIGKFTTTCTID
jgi:eukaryotic-like serine/threonine-protein kinase